MRALQIVVLTGVSIASLTLTASAAGAATAKHTPPHPVAGTEQDLVIATGGSGYVEPVVFTKNKWTYPGNADAGTYSISGERLTMKTTAHDVNNGCTYKGTYDDGTTHYEGKFNCPDGEAGTFYLTTAGQGT